jgi:hypothetical protein
MVEANWFFEQSARYSYRHQAPGLSQNCVNVIVGHFTKLERIKIARHG